MSTSALFDVTALARAGYDDASRDRLPLIVDYPGRTPRVADQGRGRAGSSVAEGISTLLRDGEVVGEEPYPRGGLFNVGPEPATYTLRTTANRPAARLSTRIDAEWTFPSAHVAGKEPADLPLLALRFAPDLDDHNAAPAGRRFTFPVFVDRNSAGTAGRVNTPAVEVSYDDGATWRPARVKHDRVTVDHPAGAEFVSLRSSVTDRDGYAQRLTIIRAYALK